MRLSTSMRFSLICLWSFVLVSCGTSDSSTEPSRSAPAPVIPSTLSVPASTTAVTRATSTTAPTVSFAPTSRYVGSTFTSFEGEIPNIKGLQLVDTGCLDVATGHCDGVWVVADDQGPMLWVATQAPGSLDQTVHEVFAISGIEPTETLHFAQGGGDPSQGPANGSILALVRGASDPAFHWTDIVAAWTIST